MGSIDVDFAAKTATVTMAPGKEFTRAQCDEAFKDSKYTVGTFEEVANDATTQ